MNVSFRSLSLLRTLIYILNYAITACQNELGTSGLQIDHAKELKHNEPNSHLDKLSLLEPPVT